MAACALLASVLLIPARIRFAASLTLAGGYGEARISWLCFGARIPMRFSLLSGQKPHLDRLGRDGRVRKRVKLFGAKPPRSHWTSALLSSYLLTEADLLLILGVRGAPAATAMLCGAAESAAKSAARLFLPDTRARVRAVPIFSENALRVNLSGIAHVKMGKLIRYRLRNRGE